jgi:hypothetical protein
MEGEEGKVIRCTTRELKVNAEKVLNIFLNGRGAKWSYYLLKRSRVMHVTSFSSKVTSRWTEGLL